MNNETDEKIIKMFNWIKAFDYKNIDPCSYSLDKDSNSFRCDVFLPKIEAMVTGFGDTYLEACYDAASQASNLIDKYLGDNPSIDVKTFYSQETHKVLLDFDDKPLIGPNNDALRSLFNDVTSRAGLVTAFSKKYRELLDDDFGFFFQAISRSVFPKDMEEKAISDYLINCVRDQFKDDAARIRVIIENDLCIVTGKIIYKSEYVKTKEICNEK